MKLAEIATQLRASAGLFDREFDEILTQLCTSGVGGTAQFPLTLDPQLQSAMKYACIGGGKRMRPLLIYATTQCLQGDPRIMRYVAVAVEMVHCYSLVHDDLPAMDDDDWRRNRPTTHKQFDEATAILAGDALLTLAFSALSDDRCALSTDVRLRLIGELAKAAGAHGMISGQTRDIAAQTSAFDLANTVAMQQQKTGALLRFCFLAPAINANVTQDELAQWGEFGDYFGRIFQLTDDLLDLLGDEQTVGKPLQKDLAAGKATIPALMGIENAQAHLVQLQERALVILDELAGHSENVTGFDQLRRILHYCVHRNV